MTLVVRRERRCKIGIETEENVSDDRLYHCVISILTDKMVSYDINYAWASRQVCLAGGERLWPSIDKE